MKGHLILLLSASILACFASMSEAVIVQWIGPGANGHFYEPISVPGGISWTDASEAANLKGGYLVTITSQAENDFVHDLINHAVY